MPTLPSNFLRGYGPPVLEHSRCPIVKRSFVSCLKAEFGWLTVMAQRENLARVVRLLFQPDSKGCGKYWSQ